MGYSDPYIVKESDVNKHLKKDPVYINALAEFNKVKHSYERAILDNKGENEICRLREAFQKQKRQLKKIRKQRSKEIRKELLFEKNAPKQGAKSFTNSIDDARIKLNALTGSRNDGLPEKSIIHVVKLIQTFVLNTPQRIDSCMNDSTWVDTQKIDRASLLYLFYRYLSKNLYTTALNHMLDTYLCPYVEKELWEKEFKSLYGHDERLASIYLSIKGIKKERWGTNGSSTNTNRSSFDAMNTVNFVLNWDDVIFDNKGYTIHPPHNRPRVKFVPKRIPNPICRESFNYIKSYLKDRLKTIHCSATKMELKVIDEIALKEVITVFAQENRQHPLARKANGNKGDTNVKKDVVRPQTFNASLSAAKAMTPEQFRKYKSKYIDFLLDKQDKSKNIIPCSEHFCHNNNNDYYEQAFLFTIRSRYVTNAVFVVVENVNPDRATLIFRVESKKYINAAKEIHDYLQSAEVNKRSELRSSDIDFKESGIIREDSAKHDNYTAWTYLMKSKLML